MAMTESQKRYEKKMAKDCKNYTARYKSAELAEMKRIDSYLSENGISANAYIKQLIKNDLDAKNIPYID